MGVLVEADRLRKTFGPITAVEEISLRVNQGEVLGFLGPNGAGKSATLMPQIFAVPLSGSRKPVSIFIVVDLPAPLGPRNPKTSP